MRRAIYWLVAAVLVLAMSVPPLSFAQAAAYGYQPADSGEDSENNGVMLQSILPLQEEKPLEVDVLNDGTGSEYYLDEVKNAVDGTGKTTPVVETTGGTKSDGIIFNFMMSAGTNNFNEDFFKQDNMPRIKIYNEDLTEVVADYSEDSGELHYLGHHLSEDLNNHDGNKTDAIYIGVNRDVFTSGTYVLVFDKELCGNNPKKKLKKDVRIRFTVHALPELSALINDVQAFLNNAEIIDDQENVSGCYHQSDADTLQRAINTADAKKNQIDTDATLTDQEKEKQKNLAAETLNTAWKTFKGSRILDISVAVSGIDSTISVGDTGRMSAAVSCTNITGDDLKQYQKVTWKASNNSVAIDEVSGKWTAQRGGTVTITATSRSQPDRSQSCTIQVEDPSDSCIAICKCGDLSVRELLDSRLQDLGREESAVTELQICTRNEAKLSTTADGEDIGFMRTALTGLQTLDLKEAETEENVLPKEAYKNCDSLQKVILPSCLKVIPERLFYHCDNLTTVDLPAVIEKIGGGAFAQCPKLSAEMKCYAALPPTCTDDESENGCGDAFNGLNSEQFQTPVKTIYVPAGCAEEYRSKDKWAKFTIKEMDKVSLTVNFTRSGGLQQAAEEACRQAGIDQSQVTCLTITSPDNVAFSQADDLPYLKTHFLGAITIDLTRTHFDKENIQASVFEGRRNLKEIKLSDAIRHLGRRAFAFCANLRSFTVPKSVGSSGSSNPGIGDSAFAYCYRLSTIIMRPLTPPGYSGSVPWSGNTVKTIYVPGSTWEAYYQSELYDFPGLSVVPQVSIKVDKTKTLELYQTDKLDAQVTAHVDDADTTVRWEIDSHQDEDNNPDAVALQPDGTITAEQFGSVAVRAVVAEGTDNERSAVCQVMVSQPEAVTLKGTEKTYNSGLLTWTAMKDAAGYQIQRSDGSSGSYETVGTVPADTLQYTDTGLKTGTPYYYRVRGYKLTDGHRIYGKYSAVKMIRTTPGKVSGLKAANKKKYKVALSWKKADGAKKYKIYRSTKKTSGYKLVKTTSGRSWTNSRLKKKKTYYYKVRAVSSANTYGAYSAVKKVKIVR